MRKFLVLLVLLLGSSVSAAEWKAWKQSVGSFSMSSLTWVTKVLINDNATRFTILSSAGKAVQNSDGFCRVSDDPSQNPREDQLDVTWSQAHGFTVAQQSRQVAAVLDSRLNFTDSVLTSENSASRRSPTPIELEFGWNNPWGFRAFGETQAVAKSKTKSWWFR